MKTDINGSSTCAKGQENYEVFTNRLFHCSKTLVQYDYRHTNGKLFSCVKSSLENCKIARDLWLKENNLI
jgi:hypothetical protein